jgi:hypothetical protein
MSNYEGPNLLVERVINYINNPETYGDYPSDKDVDYRLGLKEPFLVPRIGHGKPLFQVMSDEWMDEYTRQIRKNSLKNGGSSKRRSNRRRATKRNNRLIKKKRHSTRRR